jgi:hypothetical protein
MIICGLPLKLIDLGLFFREPLPLSAAHLSPPAGDWVSAFVLQTSAAGRVL